MKLIDDFNKFFKEVVNLDKGRIETLSTRVQNLSAFLNGSDLKVQIQRYSAQGSWAHKTIITPPGDGGFDADLLVFITPKPGWEAADYILEFNRVFNGSGVYKSKGHLGTRCVTLEYAGEFDIDVVPCVVQRPGATTTFEVCNRKKHEFEPTASEAYTAWLEERNTWTGLDRLREVTRLLKYIRDVKLTFTCKSILLTTLLGERVERADLLYQYTNFPDPPTALRTLVSRLDDYLQARPALHDICNPVLPGESFIRHWDADLYANFRDMVHKYRGWIDDAYSDPDEGKSTTKWRRIFGDEFGKTKKAAASDIAENAIVPVAVNALQSQDAVALVVSQGTAILNTVRPVLPWMKAPQWRMRLDHQVIVRASAHTDRSGNTLIAPFGSGQILATNLQLLFEACTPTAVLYASKEFDVQWQVVNTDRAAWLEGGLRGGFYVSKPRGKRWEHTSYRGVHWVQAFVIRRRDSACVARSDRFFVVIE